MTELEFILFIGRKDEFGQYLSISKEVISLNSNHSSHMIRFEKNILCSLSEIIRRIEKFRLNSIEIHQ